jgi:hypothetical protein
MSGSRLLGAFVLGLAAVGAAGAGLNNNWSKHLTGAEEVPARETRAQGQVMLRIAPDETSIDYKLIATNIDNVVQAHIHVGPADANGPVVAFLYGLVPPGGGRQTGVLATGSIRAANLVGPLAGQPLSVLVREIRAGNAYANVHTNDGVGDMNSGPGDFPGGEIRAQLVE